MGMETFQGSKIFFYLYLLLMKKFYFDPKIFAISLRLF